MKETIFFANFNTITEQHVHSHERREYFQTEKTLIEFFSWLELHKKEIKDIYNGSTIITSVQFIKSGY